MLEHAREPKVAAYDFHAGSDTHAYDFFGVHRQGDGQYIFRVYAPHAMSVTLCGDFLKSGSCAMQQTDPRGEWTIFVESEIPPEGMPYTFRTEDGHCYADPYAKSGLLCGGFRSLICTEQTYQWQDGAWMRSRGERMHRACPVNLYEVHLSSFATRQGRSCVSDGAYLNYRELGDLLARYAVDMGYTHVRLMPLTEYSREDTHGYMPEGYFAPTSRHGSPDDLRAMIDQLHSVGIGVVMDLPLGACGGDLLGVAHGGIFDMVHAETQSFLLSAVLFWLREFHLDGLSPLGLASWPDEIRGEFGRRMTAAMRNRFPDVLWIVEDKAGKDGESGLNLIEHGRFGNDLIRFLGAEPSHRPYLRDRLLLTLREATEFGQHTLVSISHQAVCGECGSLFHGMHGGYIQKFDGVRLALAYQMAHPGKKQLFMGCELGQLRPWDGTVPPDWFLRELTIHAQLCYYVRALNLFYRSESRLWEHEQAELLDSSDTVIAWKRTDRRGRALWAVFHMSAEEEQIALRVGEKVRALRVLFRSDTPIGEGTEQDKEISVSTDGWICLTLPPLAAIFWEPTVTEEERVFSFILPPRQ